MSDNFCRICRGEETPDEPLFYPCKCSGSIKYVHQECLLEWLEHARVRTRCDVCGTEYCLRRRYKKDVRSDLPVGDYVVFALRMLREKYIIWYTVRGVGMVTTAALVSKYILEFSVIFSEMSPMMLSDFHRSWEELQRRMHQQPPRPSLVPILDRAMSLILPESEFRSSWINGVLLIGGFLCAALLTWFMVIYVLNEEIMEHELDHIEHGELAHMDRGDDEELIAYYQSNGTYTHTIDEAQNSRSPSAEPETIVHLPYRNQFEDNRPDIVAEREEDELAGFAAIDDAEEDAEDLEVFLRRLVVDLFGGPNAAIFPSFFSLLFFFATLAATYPSVYWPSLMAMRLAGNALANALARAQSPPYVVETVRSTLCAAPSSVTGHIALLLVVHGTLLTVFRLCILYNMQALLKKEWGKTLVIFGHRTYAVVKSLLITQIELLVFPEFCGVLLHIAVLPITPSWRWHVDLYLHHPHATLLVQWLGGYLYMHALQIFVTACRKFFRPGVLFFLHDNDSTALMRSIMILSLPKQLRRIGHSAGIYASFILLGVGSSCVFLRLVEPSSFPLNLGYWPGANCLRLWPFLVLFRALSVPLTSSRKQLKSVLSLWVRDRVWLRVFTYITQRLDLESWFFSAPRPLSHAEAATLSELKGGRGYFVRAPVELPLLPQRNLRLFVPVTENNVRLDGKQGVQPNELARYTLVWRPAHFRLRIAALAIYLWGVISLLTIMLTYVPMKLGRAVDSVFLGSSIKNDALLALAGMSVCFVLYAELLRARAPRELARCLRFTSITGELPNIFAVSLTTATMWAGAFLMLACAPGANWTHWQFFSPGLTAGGQHAVAAFLLNFALFSVTNLASASWCGAVATADCLVVQVALELWGILPPSDIKIVTVAYCLAAYRLWFLWYSSRPAKQLGDIVRETLHLEAVEVQNYEPRPVPSGGESDT